MKRVKLSLVALSGELIDSKSMLMPSNRLSINIWRIEFKAVSWFVDEFRIPAIISGSIAVTVRIVF